MKLKWLRCGKTLVLMRLSANDVAPFWIPEAWVARRKIYETEGPLWFAYKLDATESESTFVGGFMSKSDAKRATEVAITARGRG